MLAKIDTKDTKFEMKSSVYNIHKIVLLHLAVATDLCGSHFHSISLLIFRNNLLLIENQIEKQE